MRLPKDLFSEALTLPDLAMVYELGERVCTAAHDLAILKTQDYAFNPAEYAASGGCELRVRGDAILTLGPIQTIRDSGFQDDCSC